MGAPGAWVGLGGVHVLDAYIHGCGAWVGGGIEVQVYELTGKITILYMFLEFLGDCEHLCARPLRGPATQAKLKPLRRRTHHA